MKQILVDEKKKTTIIIVVDQEEKIFPHWSYYLKHGKYKDESIQLNSSAFTRCIVGEAHGFSDEYMNACKTCYRFACSFGMHFNRNCESFRHDFMKHWNECHSSSSSSSSTTRIQDVIQ